MAHVAKYKAEQLGRMCGHYERTFERNGYERSNINNERLEDDYNLAPNRDMSQVEYINQRIESLDLKKAPRKDAVRMCDWVVTMPKSLDAEREKEFFQNTYDFLENKYGQENVVSAWVHKDESQPHMHFAFVPITEDSRLCAKDVINRQDLQAFHLELQAELEEKMRCEVEITLDEQREGERQLSYLSQEEYIEAQRSLELVRQEQEEVSRTPLPKTFDELSKLDKAQGEIDKENSLLEYEVKRLEEQVRSQEQQFAKVCEFEHYHRERSQVLARECKELQGELKELERQYREARDRVPELSQEIDRENEAIRRVEYKNQLRQELIRSPEIVSERESLRSRERRLERERETLKAEQRELTASCEELTRTRNSLRERLEGVVRRTFEKIKEIPTKDIKHALEEKIKTFKGIANRFLDFMHPQRRYESNESEMYYAMQENERSISYTHEAGGRER